MAEAWGTVYLQDYLFVTGLDCLLDGYNPSGSGVVLRLYRAFVYTTHVSSQTATRVEVSLRRTNGPSLGYKPMVRSVRIAPNCVDPDAAVSDAVEFWAGRPNVGTGIVLRNVSIAHGAPGTGVSIANSYYITNEPEHAMVWDVRPGGDVQPLVCRPGEGFALLITPNGLVSGGTSAELHFTTEPE